MRFDYYKRLTAKQKRLYDQSDAVGAIRFPPGLRLAPHVMAISRGLERDDRAATEFGVRALTDELLQGLKMPPVRARVLAVRPSSVYEELHGLYEFGGNRTRPLITLWMRTAQRKQVVAFRTFFRTLLHEVVHHLDYEMLGLEDSFHTEGFYKRSSSLFHQVMASSALGAPLQPARSVPPRRIAKSPAPARPKSPPARPKSPVSARPRRRPTQPKLPFED